MICSAKPGLTEDLYAVQKEEVVNDDLIKGFDWFSDCYEHGNGFMQGGVGGELQRRLNGY
jgi:hypothetical protein